MLAAVLGVDSPNGTYGRAVGAAQIAKTTDVALPLVLFAQIAADREHAMAADTQPGRATWRSPHPVEARYLTQLNAMGYTLSDVGQLVTNPTTDTDTPTSDPEPDPDETPPDTTHPDEESAPAPTAEPDDAA